jgi:DNA-binding transcriptional LysR family regulator
MWSNSHHLMLFYHVARHGGISRALPHMPFGIQQPALSGQILQLERDLGVKLFVRQPFRLTGAGERLFKHAREFFEPLDALIDEIRKPDVPALSVGASELILREYVPVAVQAMQAQEPNVRFEFRSGTLAQLTATLHDGKLDLAIVAVDERPRGLACLSVTRLPLVLLAPRPLGQIRLPELRSAGRVAEPLIGPAPQEGITQVFRRGLQQCGVEWPMQIEASSAALVSWYVAAGHGIGVCLDLPVLVRHAKVRVVPLPGFEPVEVVVMWRHPARPLLAAFLRVIEDYADQLWGKDRNGAGRPVSAAG